jgi:L-asparagine transporter-like permease
VFSVGIMALMLVTSGVIFAYAAVESIGTAGGRPRIAALLTGWRFSRARAAQQSASAE